MDENPYKSPETVGAPSTSSFTKSEKSAVRYFLGMGFTLAAPVGFVGGAVLGSYLEPRTGQVVALATTAIVTAVVSGGLLYLGDRVSPK